MLIRIPYAIGFLLAVIALIVGGGLDPAHMDTFTPIPPSAHLPLILADRSLPTATPTARPSATPTPTAIPSATPHCLAQLFPPDNIWNTPIDALPIEPRFSDYVKTIGANAGLHPDFGAGLWGADRHPVHNGVRRAAARRRHLRLCR